MITKLENVTNAQEALSAANLNWSVNVEPMKVLLANGAQKDVPRTNVVVRQDNNEVLGVVGSRYRAADNAAIFAVADQVIARTGGFYAQAASLKNDTQTLLQVKLPNSLKLGQDQVDRYLTFSNSFDGSIALKAFVTPIRLACTNQVAMAVKRAQTSITIRHSSSLLFKLGEIADVLKLEQSYHEEFDQLANALYKASFTQRQMAKLAADLIPMQVDESGKEIDSTRARHNREEVVRLFEEGRGHKETGIVGTAWAAYNAVAEYVDHHRSTRLSPGQDLETKRLESAYFGSGAQMKNRALSLIMQAA